MQEHGHFSLIPGTVVVLFAALFIIGGGDFGGKKTIQGDSDLPPLASADN